jgi:membrane fusion protein, heavy metal efflux system
MKGYVGLGIGTLVGFAAAFGVVRSRGGDPAKSDQGADVARAEPKAESREVHLSPDLLARSKLTREQVKSEQMSPTLELVGSVDFDADAVADVGGRIDGRITRMMVTVGDRVSAHQPLVELESHQLGDAIADLLSTRANLMAAENHAQREADLGAKQLSTARTVEAARADAKALAAELQGTEQRLIAMGVTPAEIKHMTAGTGPQRVILRAPIAGEVVQRYAMLGQNVDPTEPILRIADLSRLWVELDVYERDLANVAVGDKVDISSETYPGRSFPGTVAYVNAVVDVVTRTAQVRIEVANPERLLRPGQFVRARLSTRGTSDKVISVPRRAVLQVEGQPTVFVARSETTFLPMAVQTGRTSGDLVEVVRGLSEGDVVVTDGAFVLKSELLR